MSEQVVELTTEEGQTQFFLRAYSWRWWARSAYILRLSAQALWKIYDSEMRRAELMGDEAIGHSFEIEHEAPAMMLMGMALEALLKGCLVAKNPSLVKSCEIDNKLKTHDLVRLFQDAGITLNQQERNFCTTLTDYVVWLGRYPIPVESSKVPSTLSGVSNRWQMFDNLFARVYTSVSDQEQDQAERLYRSKEDEFYASVNKSHGII